MFTMAMVTQQGILKLIRSQKIKKKQVDYPGCGTIYATQMQKKQLDT